MLLTFFKCIHLKFIQLFIYMNFIIFFNAHINVKKVNECIFFDILNLIIFSHFYVAKIGFHGICLEL